MTSSLEELLAEEGFRGRTLMTRQVSSSRPKTSMSMPLYLLRDKHKSSSPPTANNKTKAERTRSDVSRYAAKGGLPRSSSASNGRSRDSLFKREMIDGRTKKEPREVAGGRNSGNLQEHNGSNVAALEDVQGNEIVEIGIEENESVKDIYSDKVHTLDRRETFSKAVREKETYKGRLGKDNMNMSERSRDSFNKNMLGRHSSNNHSTNSMKNPNKPETSYDRSSRGSWKNKSFEDDKRQRQGGDIVHAISPPALDEAAIQAMVSILTGHIKKYLKDEGFRDKFRRSCFSSLNFVEVEEHSTESKVIANLAEAIETVERATQESASAKELKTASLQLSVITGLNSNDLKGGITSGVPNSKLSACAHLYLSIVYKMQKKDRISAKHLLQVFCDVPFQARTTLLPELWDYLFSPHLSRLKVWYEQEANSLAVASSRQRKLKLLEKVYDEILDSGTKQFAVYYKDWLTEGVEAPSLPSINTPTISVQGIQEEGPLGDPSQMGSPAGPSSPQPMVSKKLYDAVFGQSSKPVVHEVEEDGETENYNYYVRSSDDSAAEIKETLTYSPETVKHLHHDNEQVSANIVQNDAFSPEDAPLSTADEKWKLIEVSVPMERDINDAINGSNISLKNAADSRVLIEYQHTKENELTLKRLAKSVFELQHNDDYVNVSNLICPSEASIHDSLPIKIRPSFEELEGSRDYSSEESLFANIPQDFICPLTGQLFDDPVTLETGQTFERAAIKEWFDNGNKTCPVTGKALECQTVPGTNFILKRVIDSWKLENTRHFLDLASQIVRSSSVDGSKHKNETAILVLEQLLTCFNKEERMTNAKHLISLGGLQFLVRRFRLGDLEERTRVTALLSCCIEADATCRNQIAKSINKQSLLELVNTKKVNSRAKAVLLLAKLLCLSRRKDVRSFFASLQNGEILNTMHAVLLYLQSSPPEERPLVAVLLLHLDLMVEPRKYSIYREEAVDAITVALEDSLANEKVKQQCCKVLLIIGGHFSYSGKLLMENWILKQAGIDDGLRENEEDNLVDEGSVLLDDEKRANEEWLRYLSASLLGSGRKSFLQTVSMCLGSGNLEMVRVCLTTVAWLSSALCSSSDTELQLSAFSALISRLKEILDNSEQVEHKVLASICLLNFSKISECRVLLLSIAQEIATPLRNLAEAAWTAKQLYAIISGEGL